MGDFSAFAWVALGVLIAVILPVLSGYIRKEFGPIAAVGLPPWVKKYGALLLFSLITAVPVFAIFRSQQPDQALTWYTAFLLGFAWESTLEKFTKKAP
jgi:hypothetical protein